MQKSIPKWRQKAKIDTLFMTKTAEKPYPWRRTYLYSPYKGVPLPPGGLFTLLFLLQKVAHVRTSSTTIDSLGPLKLRLITMILPCTRILWSCGWVKSSLRWRWLTFRQPERKSSLDCGTSVDGINVSGCWPDCSEKSRCYWSFLSKPWCYWLWRLLKSDWCVSIRLLLVKSPLVYC